MRTPVMVSPSRPIGPRTIVSYTVVYLPKTAKTVKFLLRLMHIIAHFTPRMFTSRSPSPEADDVGVATPPSPPLDFREVFDEAPVALVVINAATSRIEHGNIAARKMFGYGPGEFHGLVGADVTHPADEPLSAEIRKALVEGYVDALQFEKRYVRKDGSVFWAEVSATRRNRAPGEVPQFILCIIDISARKLSAGA